MEVIHMKNLKKVGCGLIFSALIFSANGLYSHAVSEDTQFKNLSYSQQQVLLKNTISSKTKEIENLSTEKENLHNQLIENQEQIIEKQKAYNSKKDVALNKSTSNELYILEVILSSDSISDLFKNLDTMKQLYIKNNKELNELMKEEEILINQRYELIDNYDEVTDTISDLETEIKIFQSMSEELVSLTSRKKDEITFNANNLLEISGVSVDDMYKALEGTALYDLAPIYVEAENLYGVNALFIAGLTAQESGWGTSQRAINDNNLTGFGVYSKSAVGINANTKRDNILQTTAWLKDKYLTEGGSFFNGYSIRAVNIKYCLGSDGQTDYHWSSNITAISNNLLNTINSNN